uniref:Uncharacterized protein n=1 Tax=Arundo donax TaxID=35708 RepID=A0A0A9U5L5_ARUDO
MTGRSRALVVRRSGETPLVHGVPESSRFLSSTESPPLLLSGGSSEPRFGGCRCRRDPPILSMGLPQPRRQSSPGACRSRAASLQRVGGPNVLAFSVLFFPSVAPDVARVAVEALGNAVLAGGITVLPSGTRSSPQRSAWCSTHAALARVVV